MLRNDVWIDKVTYKREIFNKQWQLTAYTKSYYVMTPKYEYGPKFPHIQWPDTADIVFKIYTWSTYQCVQHHLYFQET